MQALGVLFPKMAITLLVGQSVDRTWIPADKRTEMVFPDVFAKEKMYRVVGAAATDIERCAAEDVNGKPSSRTREVRLRLFRWPGSKTDFLVVAQYAFVGAIPPGACTSIARLARLTKAGAEYKVLVDYQLETEHHFALQSIDLVDLNCDGAPELIVESDNSVGGRVHSQLTVFSLARGRFSLQLLVKSRAYSFVIEEPVFIQKLDVPATQKLVGKKYCFMKKLYSENGLPLIPARTTSPCYAPSRAMQ